MCVCEHAILNVALQIQPTRPRPPLPPPQNGLVPKSPKRCSPRGKPGFLQGDVEFRSRVVRSDAGYCGCAAPSPRSSSPLPPPPNPSSHLSLHLLLFFVSASSQVWLRQPIRSTPRRCVGTSGPLCGPASPS